MWIRIILAGVVIYGASIGILHLTGNPVLVPTVIILGTFLMPVAFVAYLYERRNLSQLRLSTTALAFLYGGVIGVLGASLLEPIFIRQSTAPNMISVGLIEEFVKILGVLVIAKPRHHGSEMDGLILGAAAGMGLSALESAGYAFSTFLDSSGSVPATVDVIFLRALVAPVGHGVWTAILGAVLFRESVNGPFRIDWKVIAAYLGVSGLHAAWDALPMVIAPLVGAGLEVIIGEGIVAAIGGTVLWLLWREASRRQIVELKRAALNVDEISRAIGRY